MNNRDMSGWKHENSKWMSFLGYTLHRPPALASRIHWGTKMGANQSRNEPTPGEEGEIVFFFFIERAFIVNFEELVSKKSWGGNVYI